MRILTVTHFYEDHGGGIERVAGRLCREFAACGLKPIWIASAGGTVPDPTVETVPIHCINPTEKLSGLPMPIPGPSGIRTLAREIAASDAVIIHDALYMTSIMAMLLAKLCAKPVTLVQHIAAIPFSSAVLRKLMALANWLVTRPMLRAADRQVFISDTVRRDLSSDPQRAKLLFNGVDSSIFHPAPRRRAITTTRRILFVGRYVEKKGLGILQELAQRRPDLTFDLVGDGPVRPGSWELDNVRDLGPQTPENLAILYRAADILLLPSVGEGYPLVIQEAMACGLPVICGIPTDQADPDARRWLRGVDVSLSDIEGSAQRCAEAIDHLNLDHKERVEMSRYARERYSWAAMARELMEVGQ